MAENDFITSPDFKYNTKINKIERKARLDVNLCMGILDSTFKYLKKNKNEDLLKFIEDNAFDKKRHSFISAFQMIIAFDLIKAYNWVSDRREMVLAIILISISVGLNIVLLFIFLGLIKV